MENRRGLKGEIACKIDVRGLASAEGLGNCRDGRQLIRWRCNQCIASALDSGRLPPIAVVESAQNRQFGYPALLRPFHGSRHGRVMIPGPVPTSRMMIVQEPFQDAMPRGCIQDNSWKVTVGTTKKSIAIISLT